MAREGVTASMSSEVGYSTDSRAISAAVSSSEGLGYDATPRSPPPWKSYMG